MQKINITQFPLVTSEDFINQFYIQTRLFMVMLSDSAIVLGKNGLGRKTFLLDYFLRNQKDALPNLRKFEKLTS